MSDPILPKLRVLFVDDDITILKTLCAYFEKRGYETMQADSGREGIRLWREAKPEVAVVDMQMPEVDGFDVLRELRGGGTLVIMLTAYGNIESAMTAMQLGAENFLTKPVEMEHLVHAVEKAAEKARLMHENTELRSQLQPTAKRRAAKVVMVVALITAALAIGRWIGSAGAGPPPRAAPTAEVVFLV